MRIKICFQDKTCSVQVLALCQATSYFYNIVLSASKKIRYENVHTTKNWHVTVKSHSHINVVLLETSYFK